MTSRKIHDTSSLTDERAFAPPASVAPVLALAVLGRADVPLLARVGVAAGRADALEHAPGVERVDDGWRMDPGAAQEILAEAAEADPVGWEAVHQAALAALDERRTETEPGVEASWLAVFTRLADHWLRGQPQRFIALVEQAKDRTLASVEGRQRLAYYRAVRLARLGRLPEALAALDDLLAEPNLPAELLGRALNSKGVYLAMGGRVEQATDALEAAVSVWRELGDPLREGRACLNLGIGAYKLQMYGQATKRLKQATVCFQDAQAASLLASARHELALVLRDQGRLDEALVQFQTVADQRAREGLQDWWAAAVHNMGEVYLFQNRLDEAASCFREALDAFETPIHKVDGFLHLGLVHQIQGWRDEAQACFQQARTLAEEMDLQDGLAEAEHRLGELLLGDGNRAEALHHLRAAAKLVEKSRIPFRREAFKLSLMGRWQQVYESLVLALVAEGRTLEAFLWTERARARTFADQVHPPPADVRDSEKLLAAPDLFPPDVALVSFFTTGVVEQNIPLLRGLPADNPIRAHLLPQPATLRFIWNQGRLSVDRLPIEPNAFVSASPRIAVHERLLSPQVLPRLQDLLLPNLSEAKTLVVIPHGPLHKVPFIALAAGRPYPVLHSPSVTVAHGHWKSGPVGASIAHGPGLAVAYPGDVAPLALVNREAALVTSRLPGRVWPTDEGLAELAITARAARLLHFACHGQFVAEDPMASWLEVGPGLRLTARQIQETWRLEAELVVLSACQSGVSQVLRGDEPMGLIRAFLLAGARQVLATGWPVADLPTYLLMDRFYTGLAAGLPASHALGDAQLWLRTAKREALAPLLPEGQSLPRGEQPFAHPRNWAAFAVYVG